MKQLHSLLSFLPVLLLTILLCSNAANGQTNVILPTACQNCPPIARPDTGTGTNPTPIAGCTNVVSGVYKVGVALGSSNTVQIAFVVSTTGAYNVVSNTVNGMTFRGSGNFTATGIQQVILTGSGTPLASGIFNIPIKYGGFVCSFPITVDASGTLTLNCPGAVNSGTLTVSTAASGVNTSIPYTGGNGGSYDAITIPSTGVLGLTASLPAGTLNTGNGSLVFTITGTPSTSGTASFSFSINGQNCTFTRSVTGITPPIITPPDGGTLTGRVCFDIGRSNDNTNGCGALSVRNSVVTLPKADFTNASINQQTYTFTAGGTSTNLRFSFVNNQATQVITGIVSGANQAGPIAAGGTATVVMQYNTNLNNLALGLTEMNKLSATITLVYTNASGADVTLTLTPLVKDCACCGAFALYPLPMQWKNWMCHNLGADQTADPFNGIFGTSSYYQWGRNTDGHEKSNSPTTTTKATNLKATNVAGQFVTGFDRSQIDWVDPTKVGNLDGRWTDVGKGVNDPCPPGYKVPRLRDFMEIVNFPGTSCSNCDFFNQTQNTVQPYTFTHFGPLLTLPSVGQRILQGNYRNEFGIIGGYGFSYWAASGVISDDGNATQGFDPGVQYAIPVWGLPVRCIQQ